MRELVKVPSPIHNSRRSSLGTFLAGLTAVTGITVDMLQEEATAYLTARKNKRTTPSWKDIQTEIDKDNAYKAAFKKRVRKAMAKGLPVPVIVPLNLLPESEHVKVYYKSNATKEVVKRVLPVSYFYDRLYSLDALKSMVFELLDIEKPHYDSFEFVGVKASIPFGEGLLFEGDMVRLRADKEMEYLNEGQEVLDFITISPAPGKRAYLPGFASTNSLSDFTLVGIEGSCYEGAYVSCPDCSHSNMITTEYDYDTHIGTYWCPSCGSLYMDKGAILDV